MPSDQIEEVKAKTDIVTIINERVPLKKAGRNYKANCPFHGEKTPSFMVSPELQIYKCFGCAASGDVFSFLEAYEGMDFYEALKYLAERVGIKLAPLASGQVGFKDKYFQINALVKNFYHYLLVNHPSGKKAYDYLTRERGLKKETIEKFELGFAPHASNILSDLLTKKKKINREDLINIGLFYPKGGSLIDRFAGRVIFPLCDHRGNILGFAGRVLPGEEKENIGKYINSPDTPIYHKSKILYGLNLTKSEIKKVRRAIIVEGELDLISSYQAGIRNIVAIKGSALTPEQVELLSRYAEEVILSLDADVAGDAAVRRGIANAYNQGLTIKVVRLKKFKDPDEAARGDPDGYKKAISEAIPVWDYYLESALNRFDNNSGEGKAKIAKEVVPVFASINDKIIQAHYLKLLAQKLDVPESAVAEEVNKTKGIFASPAPAQSDSAPIAKTRLELLEEELLSLLLLTKPEQLLNSEIIAYFSSRPLLKIISEYKEGLTLSDFSQKLPKELFDLFSSLVMQELPTNPEKEILQVEKELAELKTKQQMASLTELMREAESAKDKEKLQVLEQEFTTLSKNLV